MTIPFKEWQNIDLRVGKIIKVEDHPNADKLYVIEVDLGSENARKSKISGALGSEASGAKKTEKFSMAPETSKVSERRTLVAGLRQHYAKEELTGKKCIVFVNLEPAMLRGVKSEGMILASVSSNKDKVIIIQPEKDIEPGSRIQ